MTVRFETERVLFCRQRSPASPAWCDHCGAPVQMLRPEEAAALIGVTPRAIYRRVEAGQVHFTEAPGGSLWICLNSLRP